MTDCIHGKPLHQDCIQCDESIMKDDWHPDMGIAGKTSEAVTEFKVDNFTFEELQQWVKDCADPDCRNCDGTGIFYGNVCLCGCVNHSEQKLRPRTDEERENLARGKRLREATRVKCDDGDCVLYRNFNGGCDLCGEPCI